MGAGAGNWDVWGSASQRLNKQTSRGDLSSVGWPSSSGNGRWGQRRRVTLSDSGGISCPRPPFASGGHWPSVGVSSQVEV